MVLQDHSAAAEPTWTIIMPVKSLRIAKSRIDPEPGGVGGALALAFFRDTLAAVLACSEVWQVLVATSDELISQTARDAGCRVVDDSGHDGINAAAASAATQRSGSGPVAVLVSDLPCLTSVAMSEVLASASATSTAFVADADGTGTTMWLTSTGDSVESRFGPGSAAAHRAAGDVDLAEMLSAAAEPARRDVDTDLDLQHAVTIGVGPHTLAALDALVDPPGLIVTALGGALDGWVEFADEDGRRHQVAWSAVASAGFREIRPGQRLVLDPTSARVLGLP